MAISSPRTLPRSLLVFLLLFLISIPSPFVSGDELSVSSHPSKLHLPVGQPLDSSPGARPGSIMTCNRVHIHGISRLSHLTKYAHALKVKVSVLHGDASFRAQAIELCYHRNASLGIGMCPASKWQKLTKGSWAQSMSPYEKRIIDVRMLPDPSRSVELTTEYDFRFHRLVFLLVGFVMMVMARTVSESVVFYYGSAMALGIILVVLMILFQGMKLLPTGRKSSLAIFLYSSTVGLATFLLRYLSGLLHSVLVEIGISEDMHNPLGIFLLVCLVLAGAWFGYWGVRKLVLTDEGLVDTSVAYFVEWAILIFAAVMILQSSLDTLMTTEALGLAIAIMAITRTHGKLRTLRRLFKKLFKRMAITRDQWSPSKYSHSEPLSRRAKHFKLPSCNSPLSGLNKTPPATLVEQDNYYSSFHNTPDKKRFSKEEWDIFTREQTRSALRELVSSPDFNQWAVANAERITLTPTDTNRVKQRRRFRWF